MAARKAARQPPLWMKQMPSVADIGLITRRAVSLGADALTVANTYPAMTIDFRTGDRDLETSRGALCPGDQAITLRLVWEARKAATIPIVGLVGMESAEDVLGYRCVGASAVQVGAASFADPKASEAMTESLGALVRRIKCNPISKLKDRFEVDFG